MNNYQEKLNNTYNYPIYSPLAKKSDIKINLADDKNNNISQIIKIRNEDDISIDFYNELISKFEAFFDAKINLDIINLCSDLQLVLDVLNGYLSLEGNE